MAASLLIGWVGVINNVDVGAIVHWKNYTLCENNTLDK